MWARFKESKKGIILFVFEFRRPARLRQKRQAYVESYEIIVTSADAGAGMWEAVGRFGDLGCAGVTGACRRRVLGSQPSCDGKSVCFACRLETVMLRELKEVKMTIIAG